MIPRSFIQQLVAQCDIEDIVSSYVSIRHSGRNPKGLCPFHSEKSPSFVLYPESQSFYCFGCGAGGDIISFIMRAENLEYVEAVRFLARRMGMAVPEDEVDEQGILKNRILQINRETALFFHKCLKSPIGREGYEYLTQKRGLSEKIITAFGIGFAPDSFDSLKNHLKEKGFYDSEMLAAAVLAKGKSGRLYDQFRNRVMFPIIDVKGNVIAFGGRLLGDGKPKYLNSSDTPVFKKSRNLFALNFAKNETQHNLILAEGYMDVIAIYAAGFHNVVATLGTSLTSEQVRLMSKYCREVTIAYDSDSPGQTATHRAVNLFSEAGIATKILKMEGAKDPDEFIKKFGSTRFGLLIEGASDVIEHELNMLKQKYDCKTSEGKIEYLKQAVKLLADIKNPLEREVYASVVSKETSVSTEPILSQIQALIKKRNKEMLKKEWKEIELGKTDDQNRINPQKRQNLKEAAAEEGIIVFLIKHPDYYSYLLSRLTEEDFVTLYNKKIFHSMLMLRNEDSDVTLSTLGSMLSQEELQGVAAMMAKNSESVFTKEMLDDYIDILIVHRDRLKPEEMKQSDPYILDEYRKKLREKKDFKHRR